MNIEQEKMIVEALQSQYPLQEFEEKAIDTVLNAMPKWIPVEQALPEEPFGCLVTVMDTNPFTMEEFENILPYFVGWDGEQWNDGDGVRCPFEVLAWRGLPEPYKPTVPPECEGDCGWCKTSVIEKCKEVTT